MLIITNELRDMVVALLSGVKGDNLNLNLTIKGLVSSLKELEEVKTEKVPAPEETQTAPKE